MAFIGAATLTWENVLRAGGILVFEMHIAAIAS
jgi:hypothetical protein